MWQLAPNWWWSPCTSAPRRLGALAGRLPGLIIARGGGPLAARQDAARRTVGAGGASHVHAVRLFPGPRRIVLLGRWRIYEVVQPAVPLGWHLRRLSQSLIDHPAPRYPQGPDAFALHVI